MVLVDSPNILLVFSKRESYKDRNQQRENQQREEDAGEANVRDDSPNFNYRMNMQDQRLGNAASGSAQRNSSATFKHIPSKVEIEQQSLYEIQSPDSKDGELIVDFELIRQPV